MNKKAIVIGVSAGGIEALKIVLNKLRINMDYAIIIVIHINNKGRGLANIFGDINQFIVKEACDKENVSEGTIYFAPPNYHLSIEEDYTFSLSIEEKVNYSRPSVDVLFNSAAEVYMDDLVGIILTGANSDGAIGLKRVSELGGKCIVQDPKEAFFDTMPLAAIKSVENCKVIKLSEINKFINELGD